MYIIKCDDTIIYDPRIDELTLVDAVLNLEVNTAGSFTFTMPYGHPYYDLVFNNHIAVFSVLENDEILFKGKMYDCQKDFYLNIKIQIEGLLSTLEDFYCEPFDLSTKGKWQEYNKPDYQSYVKYFINHFIIEKFNAFSADIKDNLNIDFPACNFTLGEMTVNYIDSDGNYLPIYRSSEDRITLWSIVSDKLFNSALKGYVYMTYADDINIFNYVKNFTETNSQEIEFGENLLDLTYDTVSSDIITALYPVGDDNLIIHGYGAAYPNEPKAGDTYGTNNDLFFYNGRFISKTNIKKYGYREKSIKFDGITTVNALITKTVSYMQSSEVKLKRTIEVSAFDLSLSNAEIEALRYCKKCIVKSTPHKIKATYNLTKIDIDLLNPQNTKIQLTN